MKYLTILLTTTLCGAASLLEYDINKGLDLTGVANVTASQLNQTVDNATIRDGKGIVLFSVQAPNVIPNWRFTNYLWLDANYSPPRLKQWISGSETNYANDATNWGTILDSQGTATNLITDRSIKSNHIALLTIQNENLHSGSVAAVNIQNGAVQGYHIGLNQVGSTNLADYSAVAGKLGTNSVYSYNIIDGSVTSQKIADNAIYSSGQVSNNVIASHHITNQAITNIKLATNVVNTTNLFDNSVTSNKLAADSVNASKILDGTITSNKLANGTIGTNLLSFNPYSFAPAAKGVLDVLLTGGSYVTNVASSLNISNFILTPTGAGTIRYHTWVISLSNAFPTTNYVINVTPFYPVTASAGVEHSASYRVSDMTTNTFTVVVEHSKGADLFTCKLFVTAFQ
jgi:hypothetical protein